MTNIEIANSIFNAMSEFGFEPYGFDYYDYLANWNDERYAEVEFRAKNLSKHWRFGITIIRDTYKNEYNDDIIANIYCQHDWTIDKFKRSYSYFNTEFTMEDIENNYYGRLEAILNTIKNHPCFSYVANKYEDCKFFENDFFVEYFKDAFKHCSDDVRHKIMSIFIPYTKAKIYFAKKDKCIHSIELNEDICIGADYKVDIIFTEQCSEDEEIAFLDRWFKKNKYGRYHGESLYADYVIEVNELRKIGFDSWYSYSNN